MINQDYKIEALNFLRDKNIKLEIEFLENNHHFVDDKDKRDIYKITLTRGPRAYSFKFGQSLNNSGFKIVYKYNNYHDTKAKFKHTFTEPHLYKSQDVYKELTKLFYQNTSKFGATASIDSFELAKKPDAYDVLAGLTWYDPEDFENFCYHYGYSNDSIKALKIYEAVSAEFKGLQSIFSDAEMAEVVEFI